MLPTAMREIGAMMHTLDGKGPWRHSIVSGTAPQRGGALTRLAAALRRLFGARAAGV